MGVAPQQLGIYPTLTARHNLAFFAKLAGLRGVQATRRVEEVASALGLTELLDRRAAVLPGGQKRRLHTAMAMLHRPRLLFLDEPTVGADIESRRQILELVKDLAADGCAVGYATHYLPEIEELDAGVAVLENGRILACDSVSNLIDRHGTSGVRLTFRGAAPPLDGFQISDSEAFRPVSNPGAESARILSDAGDWVTRLDAIEIIRPTLETAYLALTGRDNSDREELAHVA